MGTEAQSGCGYGGLSFILFLILILLILGIWGYGFGGCGKY